MSGTFENAVKIGFVINKGQNSQKSFEGSDSHNENESVLNLQEQEESFRACIKEHQEFVRAVFDIQKHF